MEKERLYLIPPFSFIAKRLGNRHIIMPPIKLPMKEMYPKTLEQKIAIIVATNQSKVCP